MSRLCFHVFLVSLLATAPATAAVPTFLHETSSGAYTIMGKAPATGATTTIPTLLVPVSLVFAPQWSGDRATVFDPGPDVKAVLHSPVFAQAGFGNAGSTQYADALLRSSFAHANGWHTILAPPSIEPLTIMVPAEDGYVLHSRRSGRRLAIADIEFIQRQIFTHLPDEHGKLVILLTHNTAFYAWGDATICCSWGTHGIDAATGNSFILASYLDHAPSIVQERDVQPLTKQLAEFVEDPMHDPLFHGGFSAQPGNHLPRWMNPNTHRCGGSGVGSSYFLLEPTDRNRKNDLPASPAFAITSGTRTYHVQNVALLGWYTHSSRTPYSFPDEQALVAPAQPCPAHGEFGTGTHEPVEAVMPAGASGSRHKLIGYYWGGEQMAGKPFRLRDVSPQWDIVIVSFAAPEKDAVEGTLRFRLPAGESEAEFRSDVAYLQKRGKKVMISLGGGGQYFTLANQKNIPVFVASVENVVSKYGFNGVDIDFESPSLELDPADREFSHPTTPSIVNLITALREIHDHFGSGFMLSLVPEGPQIPAGLVTYGGQFGSFVPIVHGLRDILSFVDVQDYNTPPLEGLDGEIYQAHTVDYHAAMTELLLDGFNVAGNPAEHFQGMPAQKVAVGFLVGYSNPTTVSDAMHYLITGNAPSGSSYQLRHPTGYPSLLGAMFWDINGDRMENYRYSSRIGPELHAHP